MDSQLATREIPLFFTPAEVFAVLGCLPINGEAKYRMLRLYHYEPTANSAKVLISLHEKQLPFESRWVDLHRFEQHDPAFLAINPKGQVPVLVSDGAIVTESTVIMEYLEEAFPEPPLHPSDPLGRARVRDWMKLVDEYFCPALQLVSFQMLVRPAVKRLPESEIRDRVSRVPLREPLERWRTIAGAGYSTDRIDECLQRIDDSISRAESILARERWLAGKTFTLADIAFFSMAMIVAQHFPDQCSRDRRPNCMEWLARVGERPRVQAALRLSRAQ
jgi:glutathione S-transferase